MALGVNRQVRLRARPQGVPRAEHFEMVEAPIPEIREGQLLVRNAFLSVDPAMRGWVDSAANYSQPVGIGEVMRSLVAGVVVVSRHRDYAKGDQVMGWLSWQNYAVSDGSTITHKLKETDLPLSLALGVLGLNGLTAYFGLLEAGQPRPGNTVVVSTAAGALAPPSARSQKSRGAERSALRAAARRPLCAARRAANAPFVPRLAR
jgi:NADPH-dependent curcumin reductase